MSPSVSAGSRRVPSRPPSPPRRRAPRRPRRASRRPFVARELVFEIGVEELPTPYIAPALEQLGREAERGLRDRRLGFERISTLGTPRRLTLRVEGLAERQTDHDEEATGPSVKAAFDAEGKPTKALLGFCQGKGVAI